MAEEYRHSLADANAENLDSDSAGETPTGDFLVKKMARTTKDSSSKKKKRVSKTAELENKLTSMEDRFDKKIDMLFAVLNKSCATTGSSTVAEISQSGGLATKREQRLDNVPSTGERRPTVEKADLLGLCSSEDEYSRGLGSPVSVYSQAGNKSRNVERFSQYLQTQPTIINNNVESQSNQRQTSNIDNNNNKTVDKQSDNLNLLSKLFKEDIPSESSDNSGGLIIDEAQVRQDWQNKAPRYSSNNSSTHVNYNNANSADKRSGFNYNKSSVRSVPRKFQKDNKADDFGKKDKEKKVGGNRNSFRIPKKNSS
ncbi:unnamed protein product [Mytilus edulis]|uniref:Uncharacterized protein n=1 Tax=Mytilus edulis TaxID=6550 RepID=A0A8S3VIH6_MYTED|nr:unnamed protein product [Mytilus edulis]